MTAGNSSELPAFCISEISVQGLHHFAAAAGDGLPFLQVQYLMADGADIVPGLFCLGYGQKALFLPFNHGKFPSLQKTGTAAPSLFYFSFPIKPASLGFDLVGAYLK